ncbi:MarR family winged helix-turn-helix transcriptional regulator [Nostocoides veronense]|uniref:MarR family transcriptional regulator n=1 Tax=Nostocoides veronense TaxID=330836 RepID=A0ABN2LIS7_9MICO
MPERTARAEYQAAVAAYVAAGGDESVQRVITAISSLSRKLDRWYDRQLADLAISHGDWSVLSQLARADGGPLMPSRLADAAQVAASSMTGRLDRLCERGLVVREPDQRNRTRVLVTLTSAGWDLFAQAIRDADMVEADVLAPLTTAQRRQLADLLDVVITGLEADEVASTS